MANQNTKINFEEVFAFGANPDHWESLFGNERARGYAMSLVGRIAKKVRVFCPEDEFKIMRDKMVEFGADKNQIEFHETLATTYYNAIEMRQVIAKLDLKSHQVCLSSNFYHNRAAYFAQVRHDFMSPFISVEALIFASCTNEEERLKTLEKMCLAYGDVPFVRKIIEDAKGIGTDIKAQYITPPQPKK